MPTHQQVAAQVLRESSGHEGLSTASSSVGVDRIGWSGKLRSPVGELDVGVPAHGLPQELTVEVQILVSPSGNVVSVSVLDGSGYTEIDSLVERKLRLWQFEKSSGQENDTGYVTIYFELRARE